MMMRGVLFLGWLDQFADRAAWQGHNNFLTILGATCFQILLFVVTATVFSGVGRRHRSDRHASLHVDGSHSVTMAANGGLQRACCAEGSRNGKC